MKYTICLLGAGSMLCGMGGASSQSNSDAGSKLSPRIRALRQRSNSESELEGIYQKQQRVQQRRLAINEIESILGLTTQESDPHTLDKINKCAGRLLILLKTQWGEVTQPSPKKSSSLQQDPYSPLIERRGLFPSPRSAFQSTGDMSPHENNENNNYDDMPDLELDSE